MTGSVRPTAKTASKLDPLSSHTVANLKAKGPRVVHALLEVMKQRADDAGEELSDALSKLPQAWQATMLLAHVLDRLENGVYVPAIITQMPEVDDRSLVIAALKEIKEPELARKFSEAEDVVDAEPQMWSTFAPPGPEALVRLHKKIFALVGAMDEPFPAAD
jgi:hypothetical protein